MQHQLLTSFARGVLGVDAKQPIIIRRPKAGLVFVVVRKLHVLVIFRLQYGLARSAHEPGLAPVGERRRLEPEQLVPHDLIGILGNGKRNAAKTIPHRQTGIDRLARSGILD
ncbi:hypothetical protein D9M69_609670 [compost metagenome]